MEHFIEFTFSPHMETVPDQLADGLHLELMKSFHGTCRRHGIREVGISYPEWKKEGPRPSLGRRVVLFSKSKEALEAVNSLMDLGMYEMSSVIVRSPVSIVPEDAQRVCFARSRVGDRSMRLIAKGEGDRDELRRKVHEERLPFIAMKKEKGGRYSLTIDRRDPVDTGDQFSSYGLSSSVSAPIF